MAIRGGESGPGAGSLFEEGIPGRGGGEGGGRLCWIFEDARMKTEM